jgi:hypothetical protein
VPGAKAKAEVLRVEAEALKIQALPHHCLRCMLDCSHSDPEDGIDFFMEYLHFLDYVQLV